MKKLIFAMMFILSFKVMSTAGEGAGNGGGGVLRNGIPQTFYSAGIIISPVELSSLEIPELDVILEEIYNMPGISPRVLQRLSKAINPTSTRKYYNLDEGHMSANQLEDLFRKYEELTGINNREIEIFAITDPSTKTTYIRSNFYKLNSIEKMAILIHEAHWILEPMAGYKKVLKIERDFQYYLENKESAVGIMRFLKNYMHYDDIRASFEIDLKLGNLPSFIDDDGNLILRDLFGEEYVNCFYANQKCSSMMIYEHLMKLRYENPNSLLIKTIFDLVSNIDMEFEKYEPEYFMKSATFTNVFRDQKYCQRDIESKKILDLKINISNPLAYSRRVKGAYTKYFYKIKVDENYSWQLLILKEYKE